MPLVFDTKPGSGYDDHPSDRYHFPNRYLDVATAGIGGWIIYRKPRRGVGIPGYFAVARLVAIEPDPKDGTSSYARLSDYLAFDSLVPQGDDNGRPFETILRVPPKSRGTAIQGKSIRTLGSEDFAAITLAGLHATFDPNNAIRLELDRTHCDPETLDLINAPLSIKERRISQILLNRKIRDAAFRGAVCAAYDDTCAVTGLRMGQRRRQVRSAGGSHLAGRGRWPRHHTKRRCTLRHNSLALRSQVDLDLGRLPAARLAQQGSARPPATFLQSAQQDTTPQEAGRLAEPRVPMPTQRIGAARLATGVDEAPAARRVGLHGRLGSQIATRRIPSIRS